MSRPRFNPRLQGPRSLVSGFEKRENNKRAHGSGSWFHTQDDGHRCNVVQCACRAEQNGIALPCGVDFLPHEVGASTKHHPLCVHASRLSQLVSHLFQSQGNLPRARQHGSLCPSLVINPRHCVSHSSFTVFYRIFQNIQLFHAIPHKVFHVLSAISRDVLQNFSAISRDALQNFSAISRDALVPSNWIKIDAPGVQCRILQILSAMHHDASTNVPNCPSFGHPSDRSEYFWPRSL